MQMMDTLSTPAPKPELCSRGILELPEADETPTEKQNHWYKIRTTYAVRRTRLSLPAASFRVCATNCCSAVTSSRKKACRGLRRRSGARR
jgi:hypothetical protein